VSLLEATLKQMQDQGQIVRMDDKYLQVEWQSKNLITLEIAKLAKEKVGFKYLGRLNEIYALEAQREALNALSRVGVPIKPAYSTFFSEARLRIHDKGKELTAFSADLKDDTIVAALRYDRASKPKSHLLLSESLRVWMRDTLAKCSAGADFPGALTDLSTELQKEMIDPDFRIICTTSKAGVVPNREVKDQSGILKPEKIDKLELLLPELPLFGPTAEQKGVRLSLELVRISE
jgi:hypothetical protein